MHSILIVLSLPPLIPAGSAEEREKQKAWFDFHNKIPKLKGSDGKSTNPSQNVFELCAKTQSHFAAELLVLAGEFEIQYRLLYLEKQPEWVDSLPPD